MLLVGTAKYGQAQGRVPQEIKGKSQEIFGQKVIML